MGGVLGTSGSLVIDHTMDDVPLHQMRNDSLRHGSIATITGGDSPPAYKDDPARLLEKPEERRARKRSHWVAYTTMFVMSIGFSIVLSGVWPYLHELDKNLQKESLGWVIAANPLGQMLASPLLGLWGNKSGSIRLACLSTVVMFIFGNIMYSLLALFNNMGEMAPYYAMIVSRFIVGVSSANVTLCRSYLASSTTLQERTVGISIIAAAQALGFVIGPGIQAILTVAIPDGVDTGVSWFVWDKFTAAGWVAGLLGFINLVLLLPCVFTEYNIADKEREMLKLSRQDDENMKLPKPNYVGICGVLFAFFIVLNMYVLLETLAVPFVMDQYAWSESKAMIVVGVALSAGGLLSSFIYVLNGILSKKYDERKVVILLGLLPMIVGTFLFLPWGNGKIHIQVCHLAGDNTTTVMTTTELTTASGTPETDYISYLLAEATNDTTQICDYGCPASQTWCENTPKLPEVQLLIAFIITFSGYPVAQGIIQAIFSKMLGPKPQGVWMGILTGVGSFSRIMGPIFVSYVYTDFGTRWCFGILSCGMVLALVDLIVFYKRLIPMKLPDVNNKHAYDGPASERS